MLLDQINLNQLRIFERVYRTGSMTRAAEELNLTQSGISQHIKALEDILKVRLFDRVKQKLLPTAEGKFLYEACTAQLQSLEQALLQVTAPPNVLRGEISIGVPTEFGINLVVPRIGQFMKAHPMVNVRVRIDLAQEMNEMLLRGELDFAFVDDFKMDSRIQSIPVYDEHLQLCYSESYLKKEINSEGLTREFFEDLHYIAYQTGAPIVSRWIDHHFGFRKLRLNVRATISDVLGVSRFICAGVGVGVLPRHHIRKLLDAGEKVLRFPTAESPLKNHISLAQLGGRPLSKAAEACRSWLITELEKVPPTLGD